MGYPEISYKSIKEQSVYGRYLNLNHIESYLDRVQGNWITEISGISEQGRNIYSLNLGHGPLKIFMWSQMHGNETTSTKAVLDLLNTLNSKIEFAEEILESCNIKIIPMLNPDGAEVYTRLNANGVDLNRDAQKLSQAESRILRNVYDEFSPAYCFNLHDQRSIYSAGRSSNPATVSFLAPAVDLNRSMHPSRLGSMQLVAAMQLSLKNLLGKQIGRYDDTFNPDCVGDSFQSLETPTVLFEAGHMPGDYQREKTRHYIWYALLSALNCLIKDELNQYTVEQYMAIPNNEKLFYDILIRNADLLNTKYLVGQSVGILFKEVLENGEIKFLPEVDKVDILDEYHGHLEYDCRQKRDLQFIKSDESLYSLIH